MSKMYGVKIVVPPELAAEKFGHVIEYISVMNEANVSIYIYRRNNEPTIYVTEKKKRCEFFYSKNMANVVSESVKSEIINKYNDVDASRMKVVVFQEIVTNG